MSNVTQKQLVLKHLHKKSITSWDAIQKYGITRLSDVIFKLKGDGHAIVTMMESANDKRWARYSLIKGAKHGQ